MVNSDDESADDRPPRTIDKEAARRMVAAMVDGAELTVEALKTDLVITNPGYPERGRVYVEYATGHVSWERTVWDHWGVLRGFEAEKPADDDETYVDNARIIDALTGAKPD
jgi:uncharacterized protein RhaS with RHS repeats